MGVSISADQDHHFVTYLATTIPLPALPLHRKPALTTVKIAKPFAFFITDTGIIESNPVSISSLSVDVFSLAIAAPAGFRNA